MRGYEVTGEGVAIIPILGTLVRRTVGLEALSGLTSYAELSAQLAKAVSRAGKVVEHGLDDFWRSRIVAAYRYPYFVNL